MVEASGRTARVGGHGHLFWQQGLGLAQHGKPAGMPVAGGGAAVSRARPSARLRVCVGLCLLLGFSSHVRGSQSKPAELTGIIIAPSRTGLNVQLLTSAPQPPASVTTVLAKPTRVAIDLTNVRPSPKLLIPSFAARVGVKKVTVAEFAGATPVTRVAFELTVAATAIRYRARPSTEAGSILVRFSPRRPPTHRAVAPVSPTAPKKPPAPAVKQAPPIVKQTRPAVKPTAPAVKQMPPVARPTAPPVAQPTTPTRAPGGAAAAPAPPKPRPSPAVVEKRAPPPAPRPAGSSGTVYLSVILATLLGAAIATGCWRWFSVHNRAQGRRAWLKTALASEDRVQRLSALRSLRNWTPSELNAVEDLLVEIADIAAHPAAQAARSVLRSAVPLEVLAQKVQRGRPAARARAAHMLGLYGDENAAKLLLATAETGPEAVRQAAIEGLARLMCEQPARPLLQALSSPRESLRSVAMQVLRQAGPRSGPALRSALADPDQGVRTEAIEALALVRPEGSVQAVARLLSDPAEPVRARAAWALGVLGLESDTSDDLLNALSDPSPVVQEEAAVSLAQLGGGHLEELLISLDRRACEDPSFRPSDRLLDALATQAKDPLPAFEHALAGFNRGFAQDLARAVERAGKLDAWIAQVATADAKQREVITGILRAAAGAGVAEPISRGLESQEVSVREACARLLGEAATAESMGLLMPLLNHPDESLRTASAEALGRIGGAQATEALVTALEDPSPNVRAAVAGGLARSLQATRHGVPSAEQIESARRSTAALVRAAHDPFASVRKAIAEALGWADPDEAIHVLLEMALRDADEAVRDAAMEALGRLGAYEALPILLVEVVHSEDPALRARAMEILAHAGDPMVSDPIIGALQDSDEKVRAIAGRGLWEVVSAEQCQPLLPFLNSPDPKVRASIAGTLGKTRSPEWAGVLAAAADDPSPRVRAAIVNAMARIGAGAAQHLDAVLARLTDADSFVRARAVEAICLISPADEGAARRVLEVAGDPDPGVRRSLSVCLVQFAKNGVYGPLLELLAQHDLREEVLSALAGSDETVLHQVLSHAQQASPEIGSAAVAALSAVLRDRWTVADLRPELASLDTEVRLAGLEGLSVLGGDQAVLEMTRLLTSDPARRVRLRATQLLAPHLDNLAVLQALRRAAQADPDPEVRQVASEVERTTLSPASKV